MSKQRITGTIVSNKMQRTVVIEVVRRIAHPMYKKYIKVSSKIKADCADMKLEEGDVVIIESTRPISKTKSFKVVEKVESAKKGLIKKDSSAKVVGQMSKKNQKKLLKKKGGRKAVGK